MQLLHVKKNMHLLEGEEGLQALGVTGCKDAQFFESICDDIQHCWQEDDMDVVRQSVAVPEVAPAAAPASG